ncbi:MAG: hypothetical protein KatS3mg108_2474 [Isosphaeraceae bacterium]|nr:MAG: hypothetical protein KatS3mg108_2474 [Isosphaeraceae bacterium]
MDERGAVEGFGVEAFEGLLGGWFAGVEQGEGTVVEPLVAWQGGQGVGAVALGPFDGQRDGVVGGDGLLREAEQGDE